MDFDMKRQSKRLHWEIMIQLEEAGEEDICSLLNQVMECQPYYGSGFDLEEYLDAIDELRKMGQVRVREYVTREGMDEFSRVLSAPASEFGSNFNFNTDVMHWRWLNEVRQMVELPDNASDSGEGNGQR